jgi:hypothetical protein
MNLASRCREAISQAANMKKDLSVQKRKTAEAVAQTHVLLDQLKKMKQQQILSFVDDKNKEQPKIRSSVVVAATATAAAATAGVGGDTHDEVGVQHVPVATDTIPPPPPPPPGAAAAAAAAIGAVDNSDPVAIVATIQKDTTVIMADPTELPSLGQNDANEDSVWAAIEPTTPSLLLEEQDEVVPLEPMNLPTTPLVVATNVPVVAIDALPTQNSTKSTALYEIVDIDHEIPVAVSNLLSPDMDDVVYETKSDLIPSKSDEKYDLGRSSCNSPPTPSDEVSTNVHHNNVTKDDPMPTKVGLAAIMADEYDDSEHKSDDHDCFIAETSHVDVVEHHPIDARIQNANLVSSDDYESATSSVDLDYINDNVDIDDEVISIPNCPNDGPETTDSQLSASFRPVTPVDVALDNMSLLDVMVAPSCVTTIASPSADYNNTITTAMVGNANKESKDSWLDDYDEAAVGETYDTLMGLSSPTKKEYFPHSASPKISSRFYEQQQQQRRSPPPAASTSSLNDSYEEEFPSDIIQQSMLKHSSRKNKAQLSTFAESDVDSKIQPSSLLLGTLEEGSASNLLSSIDAFEASFQTSFPESFSPKDGTSPASSPSSEDKASSMGIIYDPFLSKLSGQTVKEVDEVDRNAVDTTTTVVGSKVDTNSSRESIKNWGNGIRERATAAFQRNIGRRGSNTDTQVVDSNVAQHIMTQPSTANTTTPSVLPSSSGASSAVDSISDQSARWLKEIKASTEKKCVESIESASAMDATKLARLEVNSSSHKSDNNSYKSALSPLYTVQLKPLSVPSNSHQDTSPTLEKNSPVFRQFPVSPPTGSQRSPSSTGIVTDNIEDSPTATFSDKSPLLQDKISSNYVSERLASSPIYASARSRYVSAALQSSQSSSSERGRSSTSRRMEQLETTTPTASTIQSPPIQTEDPTKEDENNRLTVNVRERAAMYSKVSSPSTTVQLDGHTAAAAAAAAAAATATRNFTTNTRTNWRSTSRSTVKLLDDEGDIPMQTSLSPRKYRNGEFPNTSYSTPSSSSEFNKDYPSLLSSSRRIGFSERDERTSSLVEQASIYRQDGRVKATIFEHHKERPADVGKQRRHINLSGSGRVIRHTDRDNGSSPIRDISHHEV